MANTRIAWDRALETGYSIVDNQHKQWLAAVNALSDAHQRGKGRKEVERTMTFLEEYTLKHFNDEEELQEKYGYPHYLAHQQNHAEFKDVAQYLSAALHRDGPTDELISHVCVTVSQWMSNHIKQNDLKMAAYIRNKEQERSQPPRGWTRLYNGKN